jgi:hypothetical protein
LLILLDKRNKEEKVVVDKDLIEIKMMNLTKLNEYKNKNNDNFFFHFYEFLSIYIKI